MYLQKIKPAVDDELKKAKVASDEYRSKDAFKHLENAHVLGQHSTWLHTKAHLLMLGWALKNKDFKEARGQLLRIVGAATKTVFGLVPEGNTGGSNVSPFKPMPIPKTLAVKIHNARVKG
ncbi:DUF3703 domain-containing protein [Alteromonas sp. A079]|uniref:DUF3703 domain-containing protein n=1 Tax=Alteromonas sp. A079 TaxID=3410268 RepID=UPI003BA0EBC8